MSVCCSIVHSNQTGPPTQAGTVKGGASSDPHSVRERANAVTDSRAGGALRGGRMRCMQGAECWRLRVWELWYAAGAYNSAELRCCKAALFC